MMAPKHLRELLMEDQEPFLLKNFIADRKKLILEKIKNPSPKSHLQLKKQKPILEISVFPGNFCKNSCFFPSPDPNKSPLFRFQTSYENKNDVSLNIPSSTAALLLKSALRIQKKSSSSKSRNGFWFFGSLFKKLNHRSQTQKEETVAGNGFFRPRNSPAKMAVEDSKTSTEFQPRCRSPHSQNSEEIRSPSSPESPFRFLLQPDFSPDRRPPEFSPATSPTSHEDEAKKNYSVERLDNLEQVTEEEKEQSSPVSVLDPPCQDDYEVEDDDDNFDESTAEYEKAKQQLLNKLRQFEQLAGLDPIELEKRVEEEGEEDNLEINEIKTLTSKSRDVSKTVKRVCRRKCKTIEVIVKDNVEMEIEEWARNRGVVGGDAVEDIELGICDFLVEEFVGELVLGASEELKTRRR